MYGLVLEGGGAKGAYHIGAYKALQEMGIEVGAVAGTSIGALNGAMIVQGEVEKAYELWENISPSKVAVIDEERLKELRKQHINTRNLSYYMKRLAEIWGEGGLDVSPLKKLLEENIDEERIRQSSMNLGLVTVSLTELKPLELFIEDIPLGQLVDYLMASAGFPGFKVDRLEGKRFIDGGFHDNLPVNLLINQGFRDIIVVRTYGIGRHRKIDKKGLNLHTISPREDLGGILDFDPELARKNLQMGYFDAHRVFQGLQGNRYYLWPDRDEEYFLQVIMALPEEKVLYIGKLLGFTGLPYRRMLFEHIIPRFMEILKINRKADYTELAILLLEQVASRYEVERFRIYSFEEFLDQIRTHYTPHRGRVRKELPALMKRSRLAPLVAREEIFNEVVYQLFEEIL